MAQKQKPSQRTAPPNDNLVAVIAYDGLCTFEFGIAVEIFALPRPEFSFPWYQFATISAEGPIVKAMGGVTIAATKGLPALAKARTIILPGWRDRTERPPEALLKALVSAVNNGARCLSICSGVFVLAAAGLLEGKRATTHWRHMPDLKRLYPNITVEEDVLYVDEGNIITSSGSSAGIDACIHLVRRDYGSEIANAVARRLVMPPHRDGGQAQYVPAPVQDRVGRTISTAMDWARSNMHKPVTICEFAAEAAMSERTFLRRFQESVGSGPLIWLQRERINCSKEMLEATEMKLEAVAEKCGYRSLETFRVAFRKFVGVSPAHYRRQFSTRTQTR